MEYKYAHLLTKCDCGRKFFSDILGDTTKECKGCTCVDRIYVDFMCTKEVSQFFCISRLYKIRTGQYRGSSTCTCKGCGVRSCELETGICKFCYYLDQRGKCGVGSICDSQGFPSGQGSGICEYCDNILYSAGQYATCFGCYIDPLNKMDIKPATHARK